MRLGVAWVPGQNAQYRAFQPMRAMARRGHDVVWPPDESGPAHLERLLTCDMVHVFRRSDVGTRRVLRALLDAGIPFTFDNDDDYEDRRTLAARQLYQTFIKVARASHTFTTTTEVLAEKYRKAGVERVQVIGNYLVPDALRPQVPHDGVVIGWIAADEHQLDRDRLKIVDVLRRVQEKHPHVRVESIGVRLALPERYRHDRHVAFEEVPDRLGGFDIGIAPLADTQLNRARSDIKVKEYAASRTAWLASPLEPYAHLGPEQGGLLVPDDGWFDALDRLVADAAARERLAEQAWSWARTQTMDAAADRWEEVFAAAAATRRVRSRPDRPKLRIRVSNAR